MVTTLLLIVGGMIIVVGIVNTVFDILEGDYNGKK